MTKATLKIAAAQYPISQFATWCDFVEKVEEWVADAVDQQAELLLFPEYGAMELTSLMKADQNSLAASLSFMQTFVSAFQDLFQSLAERHGVYILAPTLPVQMGEDYVNRAYFFHPDGTISKQDKLIMTRFEKESWFVSPGQDIKVIDTHFGKVGISICYDNEFPLLVRRQVEMGAVLILSPSCTDTLAGYHRVRIGCQARALENQCYVAQSPTVGTAPWSESVDVNVGKAAVYSPVDYGFPDNGILVEGEWDQAGWVMCDLDFERLHSVRHEGQVMNHKDWDAQFRYLD